MQYADVAMTGRSGQVDRTLTYTIPAELLANLAIGSVVRVPFRQEKIPGVIIGFRRHLSNPTLAAKLRPIQAVISPWPIHSEKELSVRRQVAEDCSQPFSLVASLGLPPPSIYSHINRSTGKKSMPLLAARRSFYLGQSLPLAQSVVTAIQETLLSSFKVLILLPNRADLTTWQTALVKELNNWPIAQFHPDQLVPQQLPAWQIAFGTEPGVILGTRAALWLPIAELGLSIIDQASHPLLCEEQAPHTDVLSVTATRVRLAGGRVIAFDPLPPLGLLIKSERRQWHFLKPELPLPSITLTRREVGHLLSQTTINLIAENLNQKQSVMFVVAQKGWAAGAICHDCQHLFRCSTCHHLQSVPQEGRLTCSHCQTTQAIPRVCPHCQGTTIHVFGRGQTQWQTMLQQLFPQADPEVFQVATPVWGRLPATKADTVIVIEPERFQGGFGYLAQEHWLRFLFESRSLATKRLIIETFTPDEPIYQHLTQLLPQQLIEDELRLRQEHHYPPFGKLLSFTFIATDLKNAQLTAQSIRRPYSSQPADAWLGPYPTLDQTWQLDLKLPVKTPVTKLIKQAKLPKNVRLRVV